jgi:hypothetical protein
MTHCHARDALDEAGTRMPVGLGEQITPPRPQLQPNFQGRALTTYQPQLRGTFTYPETLDQV